MVTKETIRYILNHNDDLKGHINREITDAIMSFKLTYEESKSTNYEDIILSVGNRYIKEYCKEFSDVITIILYIHKNMQIFESLLFAYITAYAKDIDSSFPYNIRLVTDDETEKDILSFDESHLNDAISTLSQNFRSLEVQEQLLSI